MIPIFHFIHLATTKLIVKALKAIVSQNYDRNKIFIFIQFFT